MSPRDFVSIVMPTLNEERHIEGAIRSLAPDATLPCEILILDGGSRDRTRPIVSALAERDPRIRLIPNDKRIQAAGVNLGVRLADPRATIIVRADCHALYPDGFVQKLVDRLRETGADTVVVPMITTGRTCLQEGVAAAQNSVLGNGGAAHRRVGASGFVEHGHHAAFERSVFVAAGGYDETFSHNEDAELDLRIRRAGGRIWLAADVAITYFPRSDLRSLWRQYFKIGEGRAKTFAKHRIRPGLRQLLPPLITASLAGSAILSLAHPGFLAVPILYLGACCAAGLALAVRERSPCAAWAGIAAATMHVSYGIGFLQRSVRTLVWPHAVATPSP